MGVPQSKKTSKGICPGCQVDFLTASKLNIHRKTSTEAACKGGRNTVCPGCQVDFQAAQQTQRSPSEPAPLRPAKVDTPAICPGCQVDFQAACKLSSHRQASTSCGLQRRTQYGLPPGVGWTFRLPANSTLTVKPAPAAACKGGHTCDLPRVPGGLSGRLQTQLSPSEPALAAACKGGHNTVCSGCGVDFQNLQQNSNLIVKPAPLTACKGGHTPRFAPGARWTFRSPANSTITVKPAPRRPAKANTPRSAPGARWTFSLPANSKFTVKPVLRKACKGGHTCGLLRVPGGLSDRPPTPLSPSSQHRYGLQNRAHLKESPGCPKHEHSERQQTQLSSARPALRMPAKPVTRFSAAAAQVLDSVSVTAQKTLFSL